MADTKTSALAVNSAPALTDKLLILDDPGGTPQLQAMLLSTLLAAIPAASTTQVGVAEVATSAEVVTGTDDTRMVSPKALRDAGIKVVSAQLYLSAAGGLPKTTGGCGAAATLELSTNKNNVKYLPFDKDTEEYADWTIDMPEDWDGGTITAKFIWTHPSTTTNFGVVWGIKAVAYGDGESMDAAYGTGVTATDTGGNTSYRYKSPATSAMTVAGSPVSGAAETVNFCVYRKAADGSDTLAVDAYLIGVQLTYTRV